MHCKMKHCDKWVLQRLARCYSRPRVEGQHGGQQLDELHAVELLHEITTMVTNLCNVGECVEDKPPSLL